MKPFWTLAKLKASVFLYLIFLPFMVGAQDGANDPAFMPGTGLDNGTGGILIQSDNKILLTGFFTLYNGTSRRGIVRINADGSLDAGFNPGTATNNGVIASALQGDGKIIIGGEFNTYNGIARAGIARLNADGSIDPSFDPGAGVQGNFAAKSIQSLAVQSDGKIIIVGNFTAYNGTAVNRIARLNPDGSLDAGFNSGTGAEGTTGSGNPTLYSIQVQSNGKILIAGDFTSYNNTPRGGIARLAADGSLDPSFDPGTGITFGYVTTVSLQTDGKYIIGGSFSGYNGTAGIILARINSDGSLDAAFNQGTGPNSNVVATSIQSDGKIIIAGDFTAYNGTLRNRIARLNTNGSLDLTFNPAPGANSTILNTAIQNDGKILIGGVFTSYGGAARNRIARIMSVSVVPLTLRSFVGSRYGVNNHLVWTALNETGIACYVVERSFDRQSFEKTGIVIAKNTDNASYSFDDSQTFDSKLFYRLKIVSQAGKVSYSNVIVLGGETESVNKIFPNPLKDVMHVIISKPALLNTNAVVQDASGKIMLIQNIRGYHSTVDATSLIPGIYFIKFADGSTQKLIKIR